MNRVPKEIGSLPMPQDGIPEVYTPLPRSQQPLTPHESFQQMAQEACSSAAMAHDFLMKCQACGLPVDDRLEELRGAIKFCTDFIHKFYSDDA